MKNIIKKLENNISHIEKNRRNCNEGCIYGEFCDKTECHVFTPDEELPPKHKEFLYKNNLIGNEHCDNCKHYSNSDIKGKGSCELKQTYVENNDCCQDYE